MVKRSLSAASPFFSPFWYKNAGFRAQYSCIYKNDRASKSSDSNRACYGDLKESRTPSSSPSSSIFRARSGPIIITRYCLLSADGGDATACVAGVSDAVGGARRETGRSVTDLGSTAATAAAADVEVG